MSSSQGLSSDRQGGVCEKGLRPPFPSAQGAPPPGRPGTSPEGRRTRRRTDPCGHWRHNLPEVFLGQSKWGSGFAFRSPKGSPSPFTDRGSGRGVSAPGRDTSGPGRQQESLTASVTWTGDLQIARDRVTPPAFGDLQRLSPCGLTPHNQDPSLSLHLPCQDGLNPGLETAIFEPQRVDGRKDP